MEPLVFFVMLGLAAVLGVLLLGPTRRRRRANGLRELAEREGWAYEPEDPELAERWKGEPFERGLTRGATEVLRGMIDGYSVVSFTFTWRVASRRGSAEEPRSGRLAQAHVVALDAVPGLPVLELTPEGFRDRIAKIFGGQDVQIGNPAFDGQWRVRSSDEAFARRALDARLANLVMLPDFNGARVRVEGPSVLLWTPGPSDATLLVERARRVVDVAKIVLPLERGARYEQGGSVPGFGIPTI